MWDLPGPGVKPVSPASAGGFLAIAPPGKSSFCVLINGMHSQIFSGVAAIVNFRNSKCHFNLFIMKGCLQSNIISSSPNPRAILKVPFCLLVSPTPFCILFLDFACSNIFLFFNNELELNHCLRDVYIYIFWLHWVFVAGCRFSLVAASGSYSLLWCAGFSLRWPSLVAKHGL